LANTGLNASEYSSASMLFLLHEMIRKEKKYKNRLAIHILIVSVNDLFLVLNRSINRDS